MSRKSKIVEQSGAVPYRWVDGVLELLLITSSSGHWIVPKGHLNKDMDWPESAAQEAFEEAGVLGTPEVPAFGSYEYRKKGKDHKVALYAMEVTQELPHWPEQLERKRQWFPVEEALDEVGNANLRAALRPLASWQP